MNMNAVIYARYSSEAQNEESIDAQIRVCMDYRDDNNKEDRIISKNTTWQLSDGNRVSLTYNGYTYIYEYESAYDAKYNSYTGKENNSINIIFENSKLSKELSIPFTWYMNLS